MLAWQQRVRAKERQIVPAWEIAMLDRKDDLEASADREIT